jgi:hypothetical protein
MRNKTFTIKDIRDLSPCADPATYVPETWTGTLIDVLDAEHIPAEQRIWVTLRLLPGMYKRVFAVNYARRALARCTNPDPRSVAACDVAEAYANGRATKQELAAANNAANAAYAAAYANDAAYATAYAAAYANDAAYASAVAYANDAATAYAPRAEEREQQITFLKTLINRT